MLNKREISHPDKNAEGDYYMAIGVINKLTNLSYYRPSVLPICKKVSIDSTGNIIHS